MNKPPAGPSPKEIVDRYFGGRRESIDRARSFATSVRGLEVNTRGLDVRGWIRSDAFVTEASEVREVIARYVEHFDPAGYVADRRPFRRTRATREADGPLDALWPVAIATLGGGLDDDTIAAATAMAFGIDSGSLVMRGILTGLPVPGDPGVDPGGDELPWPPLPGERDRITFEQIERIACYRGLQDGLLALGQASAAFGRTVPYPNAVIRELFPRDGCGGDVLTIRGTGFGATQPGDAIVVFGSTRAVVVSWSDTAIEVRIPVDAGECCVSILRVPPPSTGPTTTLADAISTVAGVAGRCFGLAGLAFANKLEGLADRLPDSEQAVCAPDRSNRFIGGRPRISNFRTSLGVASPQRVLPGTSVEVSWTVVNARAVRLRIVPLAMNHALARPPSLPTWFVADPETGTVTLPPARGLLPWSVDVTLEAENACGVVRETLRLDYTTAPGLVFVGGGMRSSFHVGAIEAVASLLPESPLVCSGTGLGALTAMCAAADYPNPVSLRTFWDSSTTGDAWFTRPPALSGAGLDFVAIDNARWQANARAEVLALGSLDLIRPFLVPYKPADDRYLEGLIASIAGYAADEAVDALNTAVKAAIREAGQTAMSYVPIVAIIWAAAKWGLDAFRDHLKQQTADLLAGVPSVLDPTPLRALIGTAMTGLDTRLTSSRRRVRVPLASLERGDCLYGMEGGAVSRAPVMSDIVANSNNRTIVDASATIPLLGPPVVVGGDSLLDGSVRDPVPIGVTIEAGAGTVIVVQPNIRSMPRETSLAAAGLLEIDRRSALMRDAQFLDGATELFGRFARDPVTRRPVGEWRAPVHLIEPSVQILGLSAAHGDIGLTQIMSDYGYMRAYDALAPWLLFPDEAQQTNRVAMTRELSLSSDRIIGLRVAAWEYEHHLNGLRALPLGPTNRIGGGPLVAVPYPDAITTIRDRKTDVRAALADRLAIPGRFEPLASPGRPPVALTTPPVPRPRAQTWFLEWERHSWSPVVAPTPPTPAVPDGTPWDALAFGGAWSVSAAPRPANLWP